MPRARTVLNVILQALKNECQEFWRIHTNEAHCKEHFGYAPSTIRSQSGHSQVTVRSTVRSQSGLVKTNRKVMFGELKRLS